MLEESEYINILVAATAEPSARRYLLSAALNAAVDAERVLVCGV